MEPVAIGLDLDEMAAAQPAVAADTANAVGGADDENRVKVYRAISSELHIEIAGLAASVHLPASSFARSLHSQYSNELGLSLHESGGKLYLPP